MTRSIETHSGWSVRRRRFLGLSTASALMLAGCQGDTPSSRRLAITGLDRSEADSGWELEVEVTAHVTGKYYTRGEPPFRNVVLVGYDDEGNRVCEHNIGDVPDDERRYETQVTMACGRLPRYLTFSAKGGPCDADVVLQLLEYDSNKGEYVKRERTCGGDPPFESTTD